MINPSGSAQTPTLLVNRIEGSIGVTTTAIFMFRPPWRSIVLLPTTYLVQEKEMFSLMCVILFTGGGGYVLPRSCWGGEGGGASGGEEGREGYPNQLTLPLLPSGWLWSGRRGWGQGGGEGYTLPWLGLAQQGDRGGREERGGTLTRWLHSPPPPHGFPDHCGCW